MTKAMLEILMCTVGTFGYALVFQLRGRHLAVAVIGGALSWICYLGAFSVYASPFLSTVLAAAVVCLWSEAMARLHKAPANLFLAPGIVPLIPGGKLYYTMAAIVSNEMSEALHLGMDTLCIAFSIAGGIVLASEITRVLLDIYSLQKRM